LEQEEEEEEEERNKFQVCILAERLERRRLQKESQYLQSNLEDSQVSKKCR
jgi:hypothetical protein